MESIQAVILGIIQGVAEFLPISSSGHLELYKYFCSVENAPLIFDILLHVATLLSVILIFRKRIASLFASFFRFTIRRNSENDAKNLQDIAIILLSSIFTAIVGFALKDLIKNTSIKAIPIGFFITSVMLLVSTKKKLKKTPNILRISAILGIAQGLAVFPGLSRSGMTISVLLMLGMEKSEVCEFSFILSIPAILGAGMLEFFSSYQTLMVIGFMPLMLGMTVAFVAGLISLSLLLKVLKNRSLKAFAFYLLALSASLSICFFILK